MSRHIYWSNTIWVVVLKGELKTDLGAVIQALPDYVPLPPDPRFRGYHLHLLQERVHIEVSQGLQEPDLETILIIGKGAEQKAVSSRIDALLAATDICELDTPSSYLQTLASLANQVDPFAMPQPPNPN